MFGTSKVFHVEHEESTRFCQKQGVLRHFAPASIPHLQSANERRRTEQNLEPWRKYGLKIRILVSVLRRHRPPRA